MKKLLFSSILGLAALGLSAAPSQAWTFGLIPYHCCPFGGCGGCGGCCNKCCSTICIRPYNAFSPTVSGSMCFDGCNPFCGGGCPGGGPGGQPGGYPGYYPGGPGGMTLPPCDGCSTTDGPAASDAPATIQPTPAPAANPGPGALGLPYGGPLQAAGAYGRAPMLPPNAGLFAPYGR